jgi:hypothetical protein
MTRAVLHQENSRVAVVLKLHLIMGTRELLSVPCAMARSVHQGGVKSAAKERVVE